MYTVDTMNTLPPQLKPETISVHKDDDYTFYFGKDCPLSNFYPSPFDIDGLHFNCSEQYLQFTKAKLFSDEVVAGKILAANDPREQKSLGREVAGFNWDTWSKSAPDLIKRGLLQKFIQNENIKEYLLQTKETEIVECSVRDRFWGIGLSVSTNEKMEKEKWRGKNMMGKLLCQIRSDIQ